MTRLRADLCLLLTALIWGLAFVAQKTGMEGLGPFGFSGVRFALSALVVLPLALRERQKLGAAFMVGKQRRRALVLGVVFFLAVVSQQAGMLTTSVSNAGFLTGLYVIFVPAFAWILFRRPPALVIWPSCLVALAGVWLLSGMSLDRFVPGDWLALLSAVLFGAQVALVGFLVQETRRPFMLALVQYAVCAVVGTGAALLFEGLDFAGIENNLVQILYAGLISGGVAYTLQIVAQQYTPSSHAAIIMLLEAPFAALAGVLMMGDRLGPLGLAGCGLIFAAALLAESGALIIRKKPAV